MFYGQVLGFKGLERTVVVLAVNGFREEEQARPMLYVRRCLHDVAEWSPGRCGGGVTAGVARLTPSTCA